MSCMIPFSALPVIALLAIGIYIMMINQFGKVSIIKSKPGLAITAIFLTFVCYTSTRGVFYFLNINIDSSLWFLHMLISATSVLEHAMILTGSVISIKDDLNRQERIGKGLQKVGVSMTTTLLGELFVVFIGSQMDAFNVSLFCLFSAVTLIMAYVLSLSMFLAVLSIDTRRAELTDLGTHESKVNQQGETIATYTEDNYGMKFRSRRAVNAFLLCLVILILYILQPNMNDTYQILSKQMIIPDRDTMTMSNLFWKSIDPLHQNQQLLITPPDIIFLGTNDSSSIEQRYLQVSKYYTKKYPLMLQSIMTVVHQSEYLDPFQPLLLCIAGVNLPSLVLSLMLVSIVTWMSPSLREKKLLPALQQAFIRVCTYIVRVIVSTGIVSVNTAAEDSLIRRVAMTQEHYNEDGVHTGAISWQRQFSKLQIDNCLRNISVKTLKGRHTADVHSLSATARLIVSAGQDGQLNLWDIKRKTWMARLDKMIKLNGGHWVAEQINSEYYHLHETDVMAASHRYSKKNFIERRQVPLAMCVKVDDEHQWVAAGYGDGTVRLWEVKTLYLLFELTVDSKSKEIDKADLYHSAVTPKRVIYIDFLQVEDIDQDNITKHYSLLVLHRDGTLCEWSVSDGKMISSTNTNHTKAIHATHLFIKDGQQYFFTGSSDGQIKCWERMKSKDSNSTRSDWTCRYVITHRDNHHAATSIAAAKSSCSSFSILVSGASDGSVKVWNMDTGDALFTLSQGSDHIASRRTSISEHASFLIGRNETQKENESFTADHNGHIIQVAVESFKDIEYPTSIHSNTSFVFMVASSSLDGTVHIWRLDIDDQKPDDAVPGSSRPPSRRHVGYLIPELSSVSLNSEKECSIKEHQVHYLGLLEQLGGKNLVFCKNNVLSGVRRVQNSWYAWFIPLQYHHTHVSASNQLCIPSVSYDLDREDQTTFGQHHTTAPWKRLFHIRPKEKSLNHENASLQGRSFEEEDASDLLPFTTVQNIVTTDGYGFACDYGNFIKIISFDDALKK
ncbi:hypothetical protein RMATCC62417_10351 [Rhizopus microsporus]|nr:hypothetical protein RMATCC62417_10351 [Rhizopus microsporus]